VLNPAAGQRGMSIIEVMIAVTLAALLMALGAPSFIKGAQSRQIRTAADGLQAGLQLAKTEALRRNRNVKFTLRNDTGWTVGCETVDATLDGTEQVCPAEIQKREALEGSVNARTGFAEVVAATGSAAGTALFSDGALTFTPLGRVTTGTLGPGNNALFKISNPTGGACVADGGEMRCLQIIVSSGGQIRMCDPAIAAGDPRACS
jgi:type IV fimbrial biogenesis protein FimT